MQQEESRKNRRRNPPCKIFGLGRSRAIAGAVSKQIGVELAQVDEEKFPDGELKVTPKESVSGSDIFVFQSFIHEPSHTVNDRVCELIFFVALLRDLNAGKITAVIPYLAYARSDRRKDHFDPLSLRYLAQMLESSGLDAIISLDVHNIAAFENAFRIPTTHVEACPQFCEYFGRRKPAEAPPVIISPDIGGIKRAEKFRRALELKTEVPMKAAFVEKFRAGESLGGIAVVGDVESRDILIVDDMISTGSTILHAIEACRKAGAGSIRVVATHGLFTKNRSELLDHPSVEEFVVTDSYPAIAQAERLTHSKLVVLSCAPPLSEAIRSVNGLE